MAFDHLPAPRLYVRSTLHAGAVLVLEPEQHNYLRNALRLKEGSPVLVFNGRDGEWRAAVGADGNRRRSTLAVADQTRAQTPAGDLHYLFAPLKHARLDYLVQKAVEMGASALRPVITRRTQTSRLKAERLHANVVEAAEQCGIIAVPAIHEAAPLATVLAGWEAGRTLVFCDEDADAANPLDALRALGRERPAAVLVGPEGGFAPDERAALLGLPGVVRLALGPRILRADTAAVAALALVQAAAGDW